MIFSYLPIGGIERGNVGRHRTHTDEKQVARLGLNLTTKSKEI